MKIYEKRAAHVSLEKVDRMDVLFPRDAVTSSK